MKTYIIVIVIGFLTISCSKNDEDHVKIDPDNEIAFQVELINSNENFISQAKIATVKHKSSGWRLTNDDKIDLSRGVSFDLELENGKILEFRLGFQKRGVNKELLILEDENLNHWKRNWDYKSFESEANNLYQELEIFQIQIDGRYLTVNSANANFNFVSSERAIVNGEEKTYITLNFEGDAFGAYDPDGQWGVYKIKSGTFKGVIE